MNYPDKIDEDIEKNPIDSKHLTSKENGWLRIQDSDASSTLTMTKDLRLIQNLN